MAVDDCYLNLQTETVRWKCSRHADCNMILARKPERLSPCGRLIKLGMKGLVWWIEALALQNPGEYSFTIMDVKRSKAPLSLSKAAEPNLPAKFELLLAGSMESVRRVDEVLDKLHAFSSLFSLRGKDKWWWIDVDAKIMARACEFAKEALREAAQAAAAMAIPLFPSPVSVESPVSVRESSERSGWWIENWTVADELWATSFFPRDSWKCRMREFQGKAVENGNVVQWCSVREIEGHIPNFVFEIAVPEFLDGDDVLLRIGVANDRALTVLVLLTDSVEFFCSQEGLETGTSLGLRYLLPGRVRDYISCALKGKDDLSNMNVVEGLLGHLIRYLAFLGNICVICGCDRLLDVPQSSTCSHICTARKQRLEDTIARVSLVSDKERATRREQYVKNFLENSTEGCTRLRNLLCRVDVDEATAKYGKRANDGVVSYADAVRKVTEMNSTSIASAMEVPISDLWINDAESFENSQA